MRMTARSKNPMSGRLVTRRQPCSGWDMRCAQLLPWLRRECSVPTRIMPGNPWTPMLWLPLDLSLATSPARKARQSPWTSGVVSPKSPPPLQARGVRCERLPGAFLAAAVAEGEGQRGPNLRRAGMCPLATAITIAIPILTWNGCACTSFGALCVATAGGERRLCRTDRTTAAGSRTQAQSKERFVRQDRKFAVSRRAAKNNFLRGGRYL
mmetsp:Transcript_28962/g.81561  ORF Transcript_28962/g.81561 Transcript_28962/m.81561 type:complete len:210 (-) Transcript_28962:250-879(-)